MYYKVLGFSERSLSDLQNEINNFLIKVQPNIKVITINYSTIMIGCTVQHYALLCYEGV